MGAAMMARPTQPTGRFDADTGLWAATETWCVDIGSGQHLVIHPGFLSDGASIPRALWSAVGPRYCATTFPAAYCHDALYVSQYVPRREADRIFWRHLLLLGVGRVKARAYYIAVAAFGWIPWRRKTPESIADARRIIHLYPSWPTVADVMAGVQA